MFQKFARSIGRGQFMLKRRARRRSHWKRNSVLVLLFLVGLLFASYQYVQYVNKGEHMKNKEIIRRAKKAVELVHVTEVEKGVWDSITHVVRGTDKQGQEHIIWVLPNEKLTPMLAAESISKEAMKEKIKAQHEDSDIIRLTPAYTEGKYVWQALMKRVNEQGLSHYYQSYLFTDGSPTGELYMLPAQ